MASMGGEFIEAYVMRNIYKEKAKATEDAAAEKSSKEPKRRNGFLGMRKKVHPNGSASSNCSEKPHAATK